MQRILVVGGTGFIGSAFIETLTNHKADFLCLGRTGQFGLEREYKYVALDIMSSNYDFNEVKKFDPTVIVYLAWQGIPDFSLNTSLANVEMAVNFFDKVFSYCSVEKVIVSGSCWESGCEIGEVNPDEWSPRNNFTWAKKNLFDWLAMKQKFKNFTLIWARLFFVFGRKQRTESLIPMLCHSIITTGTLPFLKSPTERLDYISVDDVADVLFLMCQTTCPSGIYNVGRGKSFAVNEISDFLLRFNSDGDARFKIVNEKLDGETKVNFWANIDKTMSTFGWRVEHSIESDLKRVFEHYQQSLTQ